MKSYYFVYEVVNHTNGKKYIGQHCTNNLLDGYHGSNKELNNDIENGDLYSVNILEYCKDDIHLGNREYDIIKTVGAVKNPLYYNERNKKYFNNHNGKRGEAISRVNKGRMVWNKGLKGKQVAWNKGLTKENDERVAKYAKTKEGHIVTEEARKNISIGTIQGMKKSRINII
jgi:hypothetical protein